MLYITTTTTCKKMTWPFLLIRSSQKFQYAYDSLHVFEGKKFIFDIITKVPCLGDFENPGQLPVQKILGGSDDSVSMIFIISSLFWVQGINCWHSNLATLFGWPGKSRSTSGS